MSLHCSGMYLNVEVHGTDMFIFILKISLVSLMSLAVLLKVGILSNIWSISLELEGHVFNILREIPVNDFTLPACLVIKQQRALPQSGSPSQPW